MPAGQKPISARTVVIAILLIANTSIHYKELARQVIASKILGVKLSDSENAPKTLGNQMRSCKDIIDFQKGYYWIKDEIKALRDPGVRLSLSEFWFNLMYGPDGKIKLEEIYLKDPSEHINRQLDNIRVKIQRIEDLKNLGPKSKTY